MQCSLEPRRRAPASTAVSHPAHTQAVGIWALAAHPLPTQTRLSCLACLARHPGGFGQSCQPGAELVGCSNSHPNLPPHPGQGHHTLSQGIGQRGWAL